MRHLIIRTVVLSAQFLTWTYFHRSILWQKSILWKLPVYHIFHWPLLCDFLVQNGISPPIPSPQPIFRCTVTGITGFGVWMGRDLVVLPTIRLPWNHKWRRHVTWSRLVFDIHCQFGKALPVLVTALESTAWAQSRDSRSQDKALPGRHDSSCGCGVHVAISWPVRYDDIAIRTLL